MTRSPKPRAARDVSILVAVSIATLTAMAWSRPREPRIDDREELAYFEREIRPLLVEHCFECHGPDRKRGKGGLRFGSRAELLAGGDTGPAISESDPSSSLLLRAVRWTDSDLEMPPDGKLSDDAIAKLTTWIERGAMWPEESQEDGESEAVEPAIDIEKGRQWWAFRPVARPAIPGAAESSPDLHPIDAFVRAELHKANLRPSPEADRRTLARRVHLDLIGLPPTKEEVDRFVADVREDAFERLVDELLARPEYGERWARHWLDVVRYADTSGYERDEPKPFAWRYRDYVIDSLNRDVPYDRFLVEQLAGDELEPSTPRARIATGFYRLAAWDSEPDDGELARYDELDDSLRVITEGFLGVTVGCARCHDHKFDPIPQSDYYGLLAFLRGIRPYDLSSFEVDSAAVDILDKTPANLARYQRERAIAYEDLERRVREIKDRGRTLILRERLEESGASGELLDVPLGKRTPEQRRAIAAASRAPITDQAIYDALGRDTARGIKKLLDEQRALSSTFAGSLEWGLVVKEHGVRVPPTHLLVRGQPRSLGDEIAPRFPLALVADDSAAAPVLEPLRADRTLASSGRRSVLAEWIASAENPLTARVIVNRVWHHHFGRGLVATPNDFGSTGDLPSHPALLDWLASEFVANGWSLKWLHRTILTSAAWRQRSDTVDEAARTIDPDNRLLWRQNPRRLDAEAIRDSMLFVCGELDSKPGGPGFHPRLDRAVLAGSSRPGEGWDVSPASERSRRSIYAYVKRNLPVPLLEVLDVANSSLPTGARTTTTVSTQALTLLNGEFTGEIATRLARSTTEDRKPSFDAKTQFDAAESVTRLFVKVIGREPAAEERQILTAYFDREYQRNLTVEPTAIFESRVPRRIADDFLSKLTAADVFSAPQDGFTTIRGRFDNPYNVTVEMNDLQGPAALWDAIEFSTGDVSARIRLRGDAPFGSLVARANSQGDGLVGLEARVERDRVRLVRHDGSGSADLGELVGAFADRWVDLRVRLSDSRIVVYVDGSEAPAITAEDPAPQPIGKTGFRTRDAGIEVAALRVEANGSKKDYEIPTASPHERALAAVALVLLNANEFVVVD